MEQQDSKKCRACKTFFPRTAEYFYRLKASRDGLDNRCKKCDNKRVDAKNNSKIIEYKKRPCQDCGISLPPWCMSFDHIPGHDKIRNLSEMKQWSKERIAQEVAKCDVVCLNCHAMRTHARAKA